MADCNQNVTNAPHATDAVRPSPLSRQSPENGVPRPADAASKTPGKKKRNAQGGAVYVD